MDGRRGGEADGLGDLAHARRVAPLGDGVRDEREDSVRSLLVLLGHSATERNRTDVQLSRRAPILAPVPVDPAVLRESLLDYTVRTFWALVVAAVTLLVARAIRSNTIRALARYRAQANVTVLLGNLAQLAVITIGALGILAIYTGGAFGWILTSFSVVGIVIGLSLQDILKNFL